MASSPSAAPWGEIPSTLPVAEAQGVSVVTQIHGLFSLTPSQYAVPCGPSAALLYKAEPAWLFGPGIFAPAYTVSDGAAMRPNPPGLNFTGNFSITS
jgi:hypothetical protein